MEEKFDNYIDDVYVLEMSDVSIKYNEIDSYDSEHCRFTKRNDQKPQLSDNLVRSGFLEVNSEIIDQFSDFENQT